MAQRVEVILEDDIDGSPAAETVTEEWHTYCSIEHRGVRSSPV